MLVTRSSFAKGKTLMTINRNLRSLLLSGGIAVVAGLALSGCNRDNRGAGANAPPNAAATSSGAPTGNEVADMERHHQQAMDHAEMRGDGMKPHAARPTDSQPHR